MKLFVRVISLLAVLCMCCGLYSCSNSNDDLTGDTAINDGYIDNAVSNDAGYVEDADDFEDMKPGAYKIESVTEVPQGYVGIYTVEDLLRIDANTTMNYILMNDLDLSSYSNWQGLTNDAHFDGNGHTISNLISTTSGLFEKCNEVSGVILKDVKIEFDNYFDINNSIEHYHIGAIANNVTGLVDGCSAEGYISIRKLNDETLADFELGGLVGHAEEASINFCTNDVWVFYDTKEVCSRHVDVISGGIVGAMENENDTGRISWCVNNAEIYAYSYTDHDEGMWMEYQGFAGGIVGEVSPNVTIDTCINYGDVTASVAAGGIVATTETGYYDKTFAVANCVNAGKIIVSKESSSTYPTYKLGHKASGIIAELNKSGANISYCYNFGEIGGDYEDAGSIVAHSETDNITIKNCIYVDNTHYNGAKLSMDGKDGMYPESYENEEVSLKEAQSRFSQYFKK